MNGNSFVFKIKKSPPPIVEKCMGFEIVVLSMMHKIEFRGIRKRFQEQLGNYIKKLKSCRKFL